MCWRSGEGRGRAGSRCPLGAGLVPVGPGRAQRDPSRGLCAHPQCPSVTVGLSAVTGGSTGVPVGQADPSVAREGLSVVTVGPTVALDASGGPRVALVW